MKQEYEDIISKLRTVSDLGLREGLINVTARALNPQGDFFEREFCNKAWGGDFYEDSVEDLNQSQEREAEKLELPEDFGFENKATLMFDALVNVSFCNCAGPQHEVHKKGGPEYCRHYILRNQIFKEPKQSSEEPLYKTHFPKFLNELETKLALGHKEYGDKSFSRDPTELLKEISEEALDIAGWGFMLWTRLQKLEHQVIILSQQIDKTYPFREE